MGTKVKALYDFSAQTGSGELTLRTNDILTVTRQDVGEGWWEGVNSRGETGLFPAGYVQVLQDDPFAAIPSAVPQTAHTPLGNTPFDMADADWGEDDWDDDDSQASTSAGDYPPQSQTHSGGAPHTDLPLAPYGGGSKQLQQPIVRKNLNRFSAFVKSGGEDYILGIKTLNVQEDQYIYIIEYNGEYRWNPNNAPYNCIVEKPKKESKMKGLKSFIAYQITPSMHGSLQVSRRYKHFDWLQERLQNKFATITIPPLPEKQISGRYADEFIEHRRMQLQSWVNRICRHPVLSQCSVWNHFITCTDEKRWKIGKRAAEKDDLTGGSLFFAIQTQNFPQLEINAVERQMDNFHRFIVKMDDAVRHLSQTAQEQSKKFNGPYKREFTKMSNSLINLAASFESCGLNSQNNDALNNALRDTSRTYEDIGKLYENQPKYDFGPMTEMLHEYKGMLTQWPDILQVHKGALNKKKEHQKLFEEQKIDSKSVSEVNSRADVVTYATVAEINNFQDERIRDFKNVMENFLISQIDFYQKIVVKLQETLRYYDSCVTE